MKDRLQQILAKLGITATRLADELQVQRSGISHILSGRNQPSFDFISRLLNRYPEIDARWLITGQGDLLGAINDSTNKIQITEIVNSKDSEPEVKLANSTNKVTDVNSIERIILLNSNGTFELFNSGSR